MQRVVIVFLRQFRYSLSVPNLTGPNRASRNFGKQQQNLRCAKILEGRNAPYRSLMSRINNGFFKMLLSVSNSFVQHFMAKYSCTHKLLNSHCFEKVISHKVQLTIRFG